MSTITEDDIRRIVREEIGRAFRYVAAEATDYDGYAEREIESRSRDALSQVMGRVAIRLPHADDCDAYLTDAEFAAKNDPQETDDWFNRHDCSCGVIRENR